MLPAPFFGNSKALVRPVITYFCVQLSQLFNTLLVHGGMGCEKKVSHAVLRAMQAPT